LLRHEEIEYAIRQKILTGGYGAGTMLPGRRDLAKAFGTSTITVGRAIDGLVKEGLLRSDDRRGTFVAASANQGVPNLSAPPITISVVTTLFLPSQDRGYGHNPWTRQVVASLEQESADRDHITLFTNTLQPDQSVIPLDDAVARALAAKPDGLILLAFVNEADEIDAAQRKLLASGVPCVVVTSTEVRRPVPHVFPDGFDAGYQAGQHLIRQGCEEVAYIAPHRVWWAQQRLQGIIAAFEQAGFSKEAVRSYPSETSTDWTITSESRELAYEFSLEAMKRLRPNCGFVGASDDAAVGALWAADKLGLQAGRDFLLVGFDDIPEARNLNLTSLRIPWDAVGVEAARLLRQSLARQGECLQVRVRWRLIPRASSRWAAKRQS